MQIQMKETRLGADDSVTVKSYEKGTTYTVGADLANDFITAGHAIPADGDTADAAKKAAAAKKKADDEAAAAKKAEAEEEKKRQAEAKKAEAVKKKADEDAAAAAAAKK